MHIQWRIRLHFNDYLPHFTAEVLHVSPVWLRGHVKLGGGEVRRDGVGEHLVPVNIHIHNTARDPQGQHQHLPGATMWTRTVYSMLQ